MGATLHVSELKHALSPHRDEDKWQSLSGRLPYAAGMRDCRAQFRPCAKATLKATESRVPPRTPHAGGPEMPDDADKDGLLEEPRGHSGADTKESQLLLTGISCPRCSSPRRGLHHFLGTLRKFMSTQIMHFQGSREKALVC